MSNILLSQWMFFPDNLVWIPVKISQDETWPSLIFYTWIISPVPLCLLEGKGNRYHIHCTWEANCFSLIELVTPCFVIRQCRNVFIAQDLLRSTNTWLYCMTVHFTFYYKKIQRVAASVRAWNYMPSMEAMVSVGPPPFRGKTAQLEKIYILRKPSAEIYKMFCNTMEWNEVEIEHGNAFWNFEIEKSASIYRENLLG